MVKVELAGMNVPIMILDGMTDLRSILQSKDVMTDKEKADYAAFMLSRLEKRFTPEINCAAYARISRSPDSIDELILKAWNYVAKSRSSNQNIIYDMGHHSIADHALFNYNVTGISRLAVESVEETRIGMGVTEKSQRYVTLDGDYVRPKEFSAEDLKKFEDLVALQNDFYFRTKDRIFEHLKKKFSAEIEAKQGRDRAAMLKDLEGMAKEDSRYALSLSTATQMGLSLQGQSAEHLRRKLRHDRLAEGRDIGEQLYDETEKPSPSLIQLADPELFKKHNPGRELDDDNFRYTKDSLRRLVEQAFAENRHMLQPMHYKKSAKMVKDGDVNLIRCKSLDGSILSALLFANSKESAADSYAMSYLLMKKHKAREFVAEALKYVSAYDKVPREFEMSPGLVYEIVLSSSAFGQLKRHRMMTLLSQDYNPKLGFTVPETIKEAGCELEFKDIIEKSTELYNEFVPKYGKAAEYCLTNAHRKRVLVGLNERELYHISRMREDRHAQWDIREIAHSMVRPAKQSSPFATILLGGKDEFESIKKKVYNPE